MDTDLAQALATIQHSLGNIEGKLDSHVDAFKAHVEDDKKAYSAIVSLKESQARQKGFMTALAMVASGLGAGLGWIVERLLGGHSH